MKRVKRVYSSTETLAHAFFHNNDGKTECHTSRVSFEENRFISYHTCIGLLYETKDGNKILFSSMDNFSNTTAKHLSALNYASPYRVCEAPFNYGHIYPNINTLADNFNKRIETEINYNLIYSRKPDRERAERLLNNAIRFKELARVKIPLLKKYIKFIEQKLNTEYIKQAKAKERARAKRQAEQQEREIKKFQKAHSNIPLLELIKTYVFDSIQNEEQYKERVLFINSFKVARPSFVIVDGENVRTSQRVVIPISVILPLLKAWKLGHNIVGLKCDNYTIVQNNKEFLKVGCHCIPYANVKALADALI